MEIKMNNSKAYSETDPKTAIFSASGQKPQRETQPLKRVNDDDETQPDQERRDPPDKQKEDPTGLS